MAALLVGAADGGAPVRGDRAAVLTFLKAHDSPVAAEWRALGPGVDDALAAIAADTKVDAPLRARALGALGLLPTRRSRDFLGQFVKQNAAASAPADMSLLRKAALSLGWVGGPEAVEILGPLLEHADAEVRLDAAIALGLTRSRDAALWLRPRFDAEKDPHVRTQIGRQLRTVEAAEASRAATASDTK